MLGGWDQDRRRRDKEGKCVVKEGDARCVCADDMSDCMAAAAFGRKFGGNDASEKWKRMWLADCSMKTAS